MRYLSTLLVSILFISMVQAQDRQEPIRVCVSNLKNSSLELVNPRLQRNALIKALERINKGKDVKMGKAAPIRAIPLESIDEPDTDVRDKGCGFVLHTNLLEVQRISFIFSQQRPGDPKIIPGASPADITVSDARAYPAEYRTATVEYRIIRGDNPETWNSGIVSGESSKLMDKVANRVAAEFRKSIPPTPQ